MRVVSVVFLLATVYAVTADIKIEHPADGSAVWTKLGSQEVSISARVPMAVPRNRCIVQVLFNELPVAVFTSERVSLPEWMGRLEVFQRPSTGSALVDVKTKVPVPQGCTSMHTLTVRPAAVTSDLGTTDMYTHIDSSHLGPCVDYSSGEVIEGDVSSFLVLHASGPPQYRVSLAPQLSRSDVVVIFDMWDAHWCAYMQEQVDNLPYREVGVDWT